MIPCYITHGLNLISLSSDLIFSLVLTPRLMCLSVCSWLRCRQFAGGVRQPPKSALAQPRSDEYGRNSRIRGFRPLGTSARTLEKRALQEVGGFEATSAETPFDATYCRRPGHRSVGNHRL